MRDTIEQGNEVSYRFLTEHRVSYGQALYVSGNLHALGDWDIHKAIRMSCFDEKYWIVTVKVPLQYLFEYKFFIAPYQMNHQNQVSWIGHQNHSLEIPIQYKHFFTTANDKNLKIMSFNMRYETQRDKGARSWQSRKSHCASTILVTLPDLIGTQQLRMDQVGFIEKQIGMFYKFYGVARDLDRGEAVGIFVRKDKFVVRKVDYTWINEENKPGEVGFGANYVRYFITIQLSLTSYPETSIVMINTHLDNQSPKARQFGVKYISHTLDKAIINSKNLFLTGDFNTDDTDPIFKNLTINDRRVPSMRRVMRESESDFGPTFNGYHPMATKMYHQLIEFCKPLSKLVEQPVLIDHIFYQSGEYSGQKFEVLRRDDPVVSDHYPIIGHFKLQ